MSNAVIDSILSGTEDRIYHLTGKKVKLSWEPFKEPLAVVSHADERYTFLLKCCDALNQDIKQVQKKSREQSLVAMRHAIAVGLKERFKSQVNWRTIAVLLNLNDHSSAMHAYTKGMEHKRNNDALFMEYYKPLIPVIYALNIK